MDEYETILLMKPEVFVYKIPPRTTNRGYRAADWKLESPDWTGRMQVIAKGKNCVIKLLDKTSGELFAKCPIDKYPGVALESVTDSSRYFVIKIEDDNGRSAFIGIGFADRGDSFDLNVTLQDHFKWLEQSEKIEKEAVASENKPSLDLGFKDGQTITINMNIAKKSGSSKPRPKSTFSNTSGTPGLLPPPPAGVKIPPPTTKVPVANTCPSTLPSSAGGEASNSALLDLSSPVKNSSNTVSQGSTNNDMWGDFASLQPNSTQSTNQNPPSEPQNWMDF